MRRREAAGLMAVLAVTQCACLKSVANQLNPPITHELRSARAQAIRSASDIVIAEIEQFKIIGDPRNLTHIGSANSSEFPDIPMYPARITAKIHATLRGSLHDTVEFYSWIWNSGSHGGGRLFDPKTSAFHVLFLTRSTGHLQTVGDYPNYDFLITPVHFQKVLSEFQTAKRPDLFERLSRAMLTAEYQNLKSLLSGYTPYDMVELAGLTSPFYFASLLDEFCRNLPNPEGRVAACELLAREFIGRCQAYDLARKSVTPNVDLAAVLKIRPWCQWSKEERLEQLRQRPWPDHYLDSGWMPEPERRRATMRLYASAIDREIHEAACRDFAAAKLSECAKQ